jgi:hypothetical protein
MHGTGKEGRQNFVRKCRKERGQLGDKEADGVMLKVMHKVQFSVDRAIPLYVTGSYGLIHTPPNFKCTRNHYKIKINEGIC